MENKAKIPPSEFFTADFLIEQHHNQRKTPSEIAREFGYGAPSVTYHLRKNGIKVIKHNQLNENDLVGTKFKLLRHVGQSKHGSNIWEFACECGGTYKCTVAQLRQQKITNCGCVRYEQRKGSKFNHWKGYYGISGHRLGHYRHSANKRGLEFTLTAKFLWELWEAQRGICALTGVKISLETTASLDRIDSDIGYVESNVQWVHKRVNLMKCDDSEEEFANWCRLIANRYDSKNSKTIPDKSSFPVNKKSDLQNDQEGSG